jgi:hypothetical protein
MAYIGREPLGGEVILMNSIESQFNGVLTTFNLTRTVSGVTSAFYPVGSQQLLVSLGGVIQRPDPTGDTGFRISFNTIIFAIAPAAGTSCFIISYGNLIDIGAPANNTVSTDKLVDGSVTPIKLSTGGPWWLSNGNVGIGTTNPSTTLDIKAASARSKLESTTGTNAAYHTFLNTGGNFYIGLDNSVGGDFATAYAGAIWHGGAYPIIFATSNVERVRISNTGNVGIGTTNPTTKLDVFVNGGEGLPTLVTGERMRIISNDLNSRSGYLNIIAGTSAYSGLFFGDATSAEPGKIRYYHADNSLQFFTNGANNERVRIDSSGNVGIGSTLAIRAGTSSAIASSGELLSVLGQASIRNDGTTNASLYLINSDSTSNTTQPYLFFSDTAGNRAGWGIRYSDTRSVLYGQGGLSFQTGTSGFNESNERVRIDSTGNIGIGTSSPTDILDVYKDQNATTAFQFRNPNSGASARSRIIVSSDAAAGSIAVGMHSSTYSGAGAANQGWIWTSGGSTPLVFGTVGSNRMIITTAGDVGIGITNPGYKLEVNGSFAATTKSFVIPHPSKPNYQLRYACLEGPENSVYVRGRTQENIIELPDYWVDLVHEDSITVNLTPVGNKRIWVEEINNNKVYINSEDTIDCFYTVFAERKDVEKLVVEIEEN